MQVIQFEPAKHYETLKSYWAQYGWVAPSLDVLPKVGFVAMDGTKVVAAAFCYLSCSGAALLDWVIGDEEASPILRGKAVYKVVDECVAYASIHDKKIIYTVTGNESLQTTYRRIGFKDMEKNVTSLAMSLDGSSLDCLGD